MLAMGQADEASFYKIDHVSAIARRVDLTKRNKVGYSASATSSSKKRENDRDIPVFPEAKKSKYTSLPASPAYENFKKQEWVSKFGKTLKEHIAERSCKECNGYFSKGDNCSNIAVRSSSSSSSNNNGAKVIREMTKHSHRRSVKTIADTAIALEKADFALQEKSKVLSADSSGTVDPLIDSDVEMSESDDSSNADEADLRAKTQATLVDGMAQVSVSETDLILNMSAQLCKFDTVLSAPPTMRPNSICVPIVVQNVVCFSYVDTGTTFSCITNEFFNYLGETALSGFRVNDDTNTSTTTNANIIITTNAYTSATNGNDELDVDVDLMHSVFVNI
ncbi:uncharacterized protein ATC70_010713 [Mucor velutinosus]|uniref:Uncharacterized protein n=1 Tax=Mucor velutinosus TaxID=708070 RepID=A0AAN7DJJ3_9FUNG|nr:hypothetical protein ATC70_010713 [Mucor velutinosus]